MNIDDIVVRDDFDLAARRARFEAVTHPCFDGSLGPPTWRILHLDTASGLVTTILYSRDNNMHESGWFKNPDYERCFHLSLSFWHAGRSGRIEPVPFEKRVALDMVARIFGEWQRFIWEESPKSAGGRRVGVRHYRVFCDIHWQPIVPRGEVYSRELTEAGWKSWSEQHPRDPNASHLVHENPDRGGGA